MSDTIEGLKEAEKEAMNHNQTPTQVSRNLSNTTWGIVLIG